MIKYELSELYSLKIMPKARFRMKKMTPKQIGALVCVVLLVAMYVITFIAACLDVTDSGRLFAGCLAGTIALPILCWIFIHFCSKS